MVKIFAKEEKVARNITDKNKCIIILTDLEKDQSASDVTGRGKLESGKEIIC